MTVRNGMDGRTHHMATGISRRLQPGGRVRRRSQRRAAGLLRSPESGHAGTARDHVSI